MVQRFVQQQFRVTMKACAKLPDRPLLPRHMRNEAAMAVDRKGRQGCGIDAFNAAPGDHALHRNQVQAAFQQGIRGRSASKDDEMARRQCFAIVPKRLPKLAFSLKLGHPGLRHKVHARSRKKCAHQGCRPDPTSFFMPASGCASTQATGLELLGAGGPVPQRHILARSIRKRGWPFDRAPHRRGDLHFKRAADRPTYHYCRHRHVHRLAGARHPHLTH